MYFPKYLAPLATFSSSKQINHALLFALKSTLVRYIAALLKAAWRHHNRVR